MNLLDCSGLSLYCFLMRVCVFYFILFVWLLVMGSLEGSDGEKMSGTKLYLDILAKFTSLIANFVFLHLLC